MATTILLEGQTFIRGIFKLDCTVRDLRMPWTETGDLFDRVLGKQSDVQALCQIHLLSLPWNPQVTLSLRRGRYGRIAPI
jgi:hypothetical protein